MNLSSLVAGSNRLSVQGGAGGAATLSNGGTWTNASSRTFKEGFPRSVRLRCWSA